MDETEAYMELIRENIEYDAMMMNRQWRERDMYDELYQLMCDVVCVPRKTIRIAGEEYDKGSEYKSISNHCIV